MDSDDEMDSGGGEVDIISVVRWTVVNWTYVVKA